MLSQGGASAVNRSEGQSEMKLAELHHQQTSGDGTVLILRASEVLTMTIKSAIKDKKKKAQDTDETHDAFSSGGHSGSNTNTVRMHLSMKCTRED